MKALHDRIENLIYEFTYSYNPNNYNKNSFHLDYEEKVYRESELVNVIRDTITHFALTPDEFKKYSRSGDIGEMQRISWSRISKAKKFKKGDYGELLLFLILTVCYKSPKFITKVRLRSSVKEQIKGFDCAHFTIENGQPVLWLGESKFHKDFHGALSDGIKSINAHFKKDYLKDEISILYSNVEVNAGAKKDLLMKALRGKTINDIKFRVPLLLTYDSPTVKGNKSIGPKFKSDLESELGQHNEKIENKTISAGKNVEFLFLIFPLHTVASIKNKLDKIEQVSR